MKNDTPMHTMYSRVIQIASRGGRLPPVGGMGNLAGRNFFIGWLESEDEWLWASEPFSKLKTTFCKYWTSIKIKISITFVFKENEVKIKIVQEQWLQLKMKFLLGYNMKTL